MSTIQSAFWHKGQRDLVGNMCLGNLALTQSATEQCAWAATDFMVDGEIRTITADTADTDTLLTAAVMTGLLGSNNPANIVTDDGSATSRTIRQNFCSLSVAALSHVYCTVTVEKHGTVGTNSTLQAQGHFYAGEIVLATQTARRPILDLTDEAVIAEIYFSNTTSGALVVGAATTSELMGGGTATAGHLKNLAFVSSY